MAPMTQGPDGTNTIRRARFTSAACEWLTKDTQKRAHTHTHLVSVLLFYWRPFQTVFLGFTWDTVPNHI